MFVEALTGMVLKIFFTSVISLAMFFPNPKNHADIWQKLESLERLAANEEPPPQVQRRLLSGNAPEISFPCGIDGGELCVFSSANTPGRPKTFFIEAPDERKYIVTEHAGDVGGRPGPPQMGRYDRTALNIVLESALRLYSPEASARSTSQFRN